MNIVHSSIQVHLIGGRVHWVGVSTGWACLSEGCISGGVANIAPPAMREGNNDALILRYPRARKELEEVGYGLRKAQRDEDEGWGTRLIN